MSKTRNFHSLLLGISVLPALIICGANAEEAKTPFLVTSDTKWDVTYDEYVNTDATLAGVATIDYTTTGVEIPDGVQFTGNSTKKSAGGVIKALNGFTIGKNVSFTKNKAEEKGWGGGALYIKLANGKTPSSNGKVIIGKNAKFSGNSANLGGAIALEYGDLTVEDGAVFADNKGAAIAIWQDEQDHGDIHSKLTLNNSTFTNNTSAQGGAIANADTGATVTVNGGSFTNNSTTGFGFGGAIFSKGSLIIDGATFTENNAAIAGALSSGYNDKGVGKGTTTITDTTFTGNEAEYGAGAINNYGVMTISGGAFDGNKVTGEMVADGYENHNLQTSIDGGGALFVGSASNTTVDGTSFSNNSSGVTGGAISTRADWYSAADNKTINTKGNAPEGYDASTDYLKANSKAKLAIENSTFDSNNADTFGGALYNTFENTTIKNSAFAGNSAKQGGAIYNEAVAKVTLSGTNTFTGNTADKGADIFNNGAITISDGTTTIDGGIAGAGSLNIADGATLNIGDAIIEQKSILLDGEMIANLTTRDGAIFTTDAFTGGGKLSLVAKTAGEYNVFGNAAFDNVTVDSALYNLTRDDAGTVTLAQKSAQEIASDNALGADAAQTVLNLVNSSSDALNNLGVSVQESLARGDAAAVESAHRAINPSDASVVQSVASNIQGTVSKLAANRMSLPAIGRAGGDADMTSGGVWAQGLFNKSKKNGEFNGYTRGVAAGIDGTIGRAFTIGAGYAFGHSDVDMTSRDTEIDSNTVFVYGQYKPTQWYANAMLSYTMSDYTENANALGVAIDSDYKVNSFGGELLTGYDFASGVTPEVGIRYLHISGDDYTNSLGIRNKVDSSDYLTAIAGAKYGADVALTDSLTLRPELRAAVKYDLMSDDYAIAVAMPGIDSYGVRADRLNRFGGEAGIGITMSYNDVDISLNYDIEVRTDYTSQTGMVRARYNF